MRVSTIACSRRAMPRMRSAVRSASWLSAGALFPRASATNQERALRDSSSGVSLQEPRSCSSGVSLQELRSCFSGVSLQELRSFFSGVSLQKLRSCSSGVSLQESCSWSSGVSLRSLPSSGAGQPEDSPTDLRMARTREIKASLRSADVVVRKGSDTT